MITKVLNIYAKNNLIITCQTENEESDVLVKKNISAYHPQFKDTRYVGNSPIIFISIDDGDDFDFLELVNRLRLFMDDNEQNIKTIKDIENVLDIHFGKRKYLIVQEKFNGDEAYVMLRRPHANYRPFTNKMFIDAANSIIENAMNGANKNEQK